MRIISILRITDMFLVDHKVEVMLVPRIITQLDLELVVLPII